MLLMIVSVVEAWLALRMLYAVAFVAIEDSSLSTIAMLHVRQKHRRFFISNVASPSAVNAKRTKLLMATKKSRTI